MDAYIYRAALYCEDCASIIQRPYHPEEYDVHVDCDDSECCPQGPYAGGGGEADCPQHCDGCGVFLENPLTQDGYRYITEAFTENDYRRQGSRDVLDTWYRFYVMGVA